MTDAIEFMYRYRTKAHREWIGDEVTKLVGMEIILQTYPVRRWTPKGVWIYDPFSHREKWISLFTRRAFAYANKADALNSFKIRNAYHIQYLMRDLHAARMAKRAAVNEDLYEPATWLEAGMRKRKLERLTIKE
jgi:hypothetical protein